MMNLTATLYAFNIITYSISLLKSSVSIPEKYYKNIMIDTSQFWWPKFRFIYNILKKISQKQNDFKTTLIILAWIGFKYYINTYMYLLTYVTKYFGYSNNKNWYVFLIFIKCMTQCSNRMTLKKNQNIVLLICIKWHTLQNCGSVYLLRMWHSHARYVIVVINKTNFSYCK